MHKVERCGWRCSLDKYSRSCRPWPSPCATQTQLAACTLASGERHNTLVRDWCLHCEQFTGIAVGLTFNSMIGEYQGVRSANGQNNTEVKCDDLRRQGVSTPRHCFADQLCRRSKGSVPLAPGNASELAMQSDTFAAVHSLLRVQAMRKAE